MISLQSSLPSLSALLQCQNMSLFIIADKVEETLITRPHSFLRHREMIKTFVKIHCIKAYLSKCNTEILFVLYPKKVFG